MPYLDVHADAGGGATVVDSPRPAAPAPAPTRPRSPGRRAAGDALVGVVALVAFASVMTAFSGQAMGHAGHAGHVGPVAADYLAIGAAEVVAPAARPGPAASTGSFTARCGRNTDGHRNSDNYITAPGRSNGAHHVHDYVGNTSTTGTSTDQTLAAATTTCTRGDKSVYFWPVLRDTRHPGPDTNHPGSGADGNHGHILTPDQVTITFLGNPHAPVQPMPQYLRVVTGDAKAVTKGPAAAARAHWTCSGTPNRATSSHYPLCPAGQLVHRVGEFPSCWNHTTLDSHTHRSHVTFPNPTTGACPTGTIPIPRLQITLAYRVPTGHSYAIDTFPDQHRKPITDHYDFENLIPDTLMTHLTTCLNTGRTC